MEISAAFLLGFAIIASATCKTWILVLAFRESPVWGLACFVPFVMPLYIVTRWEQTQVPILGFGLPSLVLLITALHSGKARPFLPCLERKSSKSAAPWD